jgi:hypothetical protein
MPKKQPPRHVAEKDDRLRIKFSKTCEFSVSQSNVSERFIEWFAERMNAPKDDVAVVTMAQNAEWFFGIKYAEDLLSAATALALEAAIAHAVYLWNGKAISGGITLEKFPRKNIAKWRNEMLRNFDARIREVLNFSKRGQVAGERPAKDRNRAAFERRDELIDQFVGSGMTRRKAEIKAKPIVMREFGLKSAGAYSRAMSEGRRAI